MRKLTVMVIILLAGSVILVGCFYDKELDENEGGIPTNVSFSNDVIPVFTKNCSTSGCHDATPTHKPSLVPDQAYVALTGGGYVSVTVPSSGKLYQEIIEGNMPPGQPMAAKDANIIIGWLNEGAKNN